MCFGSFSLCVVFVGDNDAYDRELDSIHQDFLDVDGVEHFDDIMNRLYDYGDLNVPPFGVSQKQSAWIGTSSTMAKRNPRSDNTATPGWYLFAWIPSGAPGGRVKAADTWYA